MPNIQNLQTFYRLLLLLAVMFASCNQDYLPCKSGKGDRVAFKRNVEGFNQIELRGSGDVQLREDSSYSFEGFAQENLHSDLDIRVKGQKLIIDQKECFRSHKDIHYEIGMPTVIRAKISGSGQINSPDTFGSEQMSLEVSGSGKIKMPIQSQNLNTSISGSGDIHLKGPIHKHNLKISGSGDFWGEDLRSELCNVQISGSGAAQVYVIDQLDVKISGSGDVIYRGSPDVNSNITGSGEIRKAK